jgi:HEAT repeat protein
MLPVIRALALAFSAATLSSLVAADTPPEVVKLIEQLKDRDETVRLKAAKELGKLKEKAKDAIPALMAATADSDEDVRLVAGKALAIIKEASGKGAPGKGDAAKGDAKIVLLIKELQSKDAKVRIAAIAKLEELGEEAKPAGAALVEFGMLSNLKGVKEAAATTLEKIDPEPYKDIAILCFDTDFDKISKAFVKLGELGSDAKAAIPAMKRLYQKNTFEQKQADGRLVPVAIPVYILESMILTSPEDPSVCKLVTDAVCHTRAFMDRNGRIREVGGQSIMAVALLRTIKASDRDKAFALAQGAVGVTNSVDRNRLIEEISNLSAENKDKYQIYMGLLKVLKTDRATVIVKLGELGADAKGAIPALLSLKTDKEEAVRNAASAAIEAIKSGTKE